MDEGNGKDNTNNVRIGVEHEPGNIKDAINCHSLAHVTNDTDEDELFARQSMETKAANENTILTQETQAISEAQPVRLQLQQNEPKATKAEETDLEIKQDSDDSSDSSDSGSEYVGDCSDRDSEDKECARREPGKKRASRKSRKGATAVQEDLEDAQDQLVMLLAEQNNLKRRQSNNSLKPGQAVRLEELGQLIASLERRIQDLTVTQGASRLPGAERDSGIESSHFEEQTSDSSLVGTAATIPSAAAQKRKAPAQRIAPLAGKKVKASGALNENIFAAGESMADMPVLDGFDATTAKSQDRQFKELSSKLPGADQQEIRGDHVMLIKARSALKRRYKVLGEKYLVMGMKTPLYAYQFVATGWMVDDGGPLALLLKETMLKRYVPNAIPSDMSTVLF
ncbi:hypothetical protein VTG60DRAFT_2662 [Thermothelomyces hinnuleus]